MKVFISWSKPVSHGLGLVLRDWLPEVIQSIEPWVSSEDIDKGQRWGAEVGAQLGELGQGVLCVTPENQHEPWLNFEAGALAKSLDGARVRPVLLGLQPSEITGPLAQFQATVASDHDDMLRLIVSLNAACASPLDSTRLERAFDRNWEDYLLKLSTLPAAASTNGPVRRSQDDMIGEVLERIRELQRSIAQPASQQRRDADASAGSRLVNSLIVLPHGGLGRVLGTTEMLSGEVFAVVKDGSGKRNVFNVKDLRLATKDDLQHDLFEGDGDLP
ncbi:hypothetical protein ACPSM1_28365 [Micromonospora chersina]|uniref:hypothetical protein n=1 Tax=Micromonospora chersina TaxID=47854 RepID=UPI003CB5900A